MASHTSNMGFYLPDITDKFSAFVQGIKENFQKLDGGTASSGGSSGGGGGGGSSSTGSGGGIWPVGSIYISVNSTNPQTFFGGTWQAINDVFLVARGTQFAAGSTGGTSSHSHEIPLGFDAAALYARGKTNGDRSPYFGSKHIASAWGLVWEKQWEIRQTQVRDALTDTASNLPPYLAVYMWKRTA